MIQSAQNACLHLIMDPVNILSKSLLHLLGRQSGILEDGAADRADELLVHGALEPDDIIAHDGSSAKRDNLQISESTVSIGL